MSATELRALRSTIAQPHRSQIRVSALNLAGDRLADLTPYLDDGQVDVDSTADVTRSCSLQLLDTRRALPFDSDHPSDTALFLDRMVAVSYVVLVGSTWRSIPIFTGPVSKLDRDGDVVTVEAQGKESLLLGAAWAPITLHKGQTKDDAIRRLLREGNPAYRESRLDLPNVSARLPKAIGLKRDSVPWTVAQSVARSMGRQLFYDGRGTARLRSWPGVSGFSFTGGAHVTSPIQVSFSADVVNAAQVIGGTPKGSKKHVHATAVAPRSHPLSPYRIGRYLLPDGQITQDDSVKTTHEAQQLASRLVADGLLQSVDVAFDALPVPFLEPGDLCHVATDDGSITFRLQKFSIPLTAGDSMSVGYTRRVSLKHARRKRR